MRIAAILWCAAIPGLQVYIFRRIRDDLVKNHMEGPKGFRAILAGWVLVGFCTIVEDEIRFWNGSKIYLCHCKDEKDIYKYQGAEIHVLLIDEITHFTQSMYRFLRNRVRMVGITLPPEYVGMFPRILCGGNPGNIGHLWVKATWVDLLQPLEIRRMSPQEGGMLRQFIPARLDDNPSMEEDDPGYESRLEGLGSATLVKAMRWGDWNVVEGAYFDCWDSAKHVVRPVELPDHWFRFRSFDWGSARPFSVGWWAVSDGTMPQFPKGALVRYREWYGCSEPNVGLKMRIEDVAAGIKAKEMSDPKPEGGRLGVADSSIFDEDGGPSIAEKFAENGVLWKRADKRRIPGWQQMRDRMIGEDGKPMIYTFSTCTHSIRTIPALQHDKDKIEDLETDDSEDHAADEWRYACMSRPYIKPKPVKTEMRGLPEMTLNELWEKSKVNHSNRI